MKLKTITIKDIRDLEPCYDSIEKISEDWTGTILDILKLEDVEPRDKIWVVSHLLDDKTKRLFSVWCAREALKLVKNPDKRSVEACDVAERFAYGRATLKELKEASAYAYASASAYSASASASAYSASASASARERQIEQLIKMIEMGINE